MNLKVAIISSICFSIVIALLGFSYYLWQENQSSKVLAEQKTRELEDIKIAEMEEKIQALENELESNDNKESEKIEAVPEIVVSNKSEDKEKMGERYCPALKECGHEYTDDYTCNNAVCCKVDGVTMISFAAWACDDGYKDVYLTSANSTVRCKENSVDSIKSMDIAFKNELKDYSDCLSLGNDEDFCEDYIPTADSLKESLSDNCVNQ